jgi:hypothetical protein
MVTVPRFAAQRNRTPLAAAFSPAQLAAMVRAAARHSADGRRAARLTELAFHAPTLADAAALDAVAARLRERAEEGVRTLLLR